MRISTERGAPGFREDALELDISIQFNGKVVNNCVMADSDTGELSVAGRKIACETETGRDERPGMWTVFHYKGKVEIIENGTERRL